MKNRHISFPTFAAIATFAALLLSSCDPYSIAESGMDVSIDIKVNRISAGFINVEFTPDRDAFYLISVDEVIPGIDPSKLERQFMDLALDSAYVEYVTWRHDHLMSMEPAVADFPSHSLNYSKTNMIVNYLKPDTDYWVYAFVVDRESNKANGRLFYKTIHTEKESIFKDIRFAYRVAGYWDYVYPYNTITEELVTDVPWIGKTIDSLDLVKLGYETPGHYFDHEFSLYEENKGTIFTGVYAHKNDGIGDGSSKTLFEFGHIYYTAIATLDGPRNECFDIYKFKWDGTAAALILTDSSSTKGEW